MIKDESDDCFKATESRACSHSFLAETGRRGNVTVTLNAINGVLIATFNIAAGETIVKAKLPETIIVAELRKENDFEFYFRKLIPVIH